MVSISLSLATPRSVLLPTSHLFDLSSSFFSFVAFFFQVGYDVLTRVSDLHRDDSITPLNLLSFPPSSLLSSSDASPSPQFPHLPSLTLSG